jgi:hypothetical protein
MEGTVSWGEYVGAGSDPEGHTKEAHLRLENKA